MYYNINIYKGKEYLTTKHIQNLFYHIYCYLCKVTTYSINLHTVTKKYEVTNK